MSNVAKVLKQEIARISRKEIKTAIGDLGKSQTNLKRIVADLKKKVASLEKENKRLTKEASKQKAPSVEKLPEQQEKARFTSKAIRSLRSRLHLTRAEFAKLVGVAEQSVYLWENKEGVLNLRDKTREVLLSIKGLGAREAKSKLEETGGKRIKEGAASPKKRKKS